MRSGVFATQAGARAAAVLPAETRAVRHPVFDVCLSYETREVVADAAAPVNYSAGAIAVMLDNGSVRSISELRSRARSRPPATLAGSSW